MFALEITDLKKKYSGGNYAVKGINLCVREGDFFALLGPNGAGKSTTIGILSSLVVKTGGNVFVNGFNQDKDPAKVKASLGLVPQEFNLNIFETCQSVLINQAGYYGVPYQVALERSEKYLKLMSLWNERKVQVRALSGGMKRRLMIARAIMHDPPILILDEPTAGVDVELRKFIWSFLEDLNQKQKKTIILTTHYLEEVERLCHNVAIINEGRIVSNGSLEELVGKLPGQVYLLSFDQELGKEDQNKLKEFSYEIRALDLKTYEISLDKSLTVSDAFSELSQLNSKVRSIRPKENPIESAFFHVTNHKKGE